MNKYTCKFCGETWYPRVESPKACPYCKRYFLVKKPKHETIR